MWRKSEDDEAIPDRIGVGITRSAKGIVVVFMPTEGGASAYRLTQPQAVGLATLLIQAAKELKLAS